MERCEICSKEKEYKSLTQEEKNHCKSIGIDVFKFGAWTYACRCPIFIFDELIYIKDNKYTFTQDEFHKFRKLVSRKKAFLDSLNLIIKDPMVNYYDIAKLEWSRVLKKIKIWEGMNEFERTKKKIELKDLDLEVDEIQKGIWQILYNLKCID